MPGMNGIELLEKVKGIDSAITRVLMTAFEIEDKVFDHGQCVEMFLQKPIRIPDSIEKLQKSLGVINKKLKQNR
jgi:CheY-like chemotaxis protein